MVEVYIAAWNYGKNKAATYQETQNPSAQPAEANQRSYDKFILDVAYMFQNRETASKSFLSKVYNATYIFRWMFYSFIAVTFFNRTRSTYFIFTVGGVVAIIWTILTLKHFNKPAGILILLSEIFVFLRHLVQWLNFIDYADGDSYFKQGFTNFLTNVAFFSYLFGSLIELALLFEPFYSKNSQANPQTTNTDNNNANNNGQVDQTPSQQLDELEIDADGELENRINTYKTMKSKKVTGGKTQDANADVKLNANANVNGNANAQAQVNAQA
jgi:hypothetical protein